MKEKHFIITIDENMAVKEANGTINRNSNGSQWLGVALDGWDLNEGDELYIQLRYYDDNSELTTQIGPLHLFYNSALNRYVTIAPPELVRMAGEWNYSLELRFNVSESTDGKPKTSTTTVKDSSGNIISTKVTELNDIEIAYDSLTSETYTLSVTDSIIQPDTGNIIKETDLNAAMQTLANNTTASLEAAKAAENSATEAEAKAIEAKKSAEKAEAVFSKTIKSVSIAYCASSLGTVAPISGWSTSMPSASPGQYVWTRTIYTYNNGLTQTAYTIGKIGSTGSRGADGVSISSIELVESTVDGNVYRVLSSKGTEIGKITAPSGVELVTELFAKKTDLEAATNIANIASTRANSAYSRANNAYNQANAAYNLAHSAFEKADSGIDGITQGNSDDIDIEKPLNFIVPVDEESGLTNYSLRFASNSPRARQYLDVQYLPQEDALAFTGHIISDKTIQGADGVYDGEERVYSPINPPPETRANAAYDKANNAYALGANAYAWANNAYGLASAAMSSFSGIYNIATELNRAIKMVDGNDLGDAVCGGSQAVVLGWGANAIGSSTVAIGYAAKCPYSASVAIGASASAGAPDSTALGYNASVSANNSIAIGYYANANTANTIVLGGNTIQYIKCKVQTISSLSDERTKEDIEIVNAAQCLADVERLPVKRFKFKKFANRNPVDVHRTGFIAQDVERVFPKDILSSPESFPVLDDDGNPVTENELDENGNLIYEQIGEREDGSPIYSDTPKQKEKQFTIEDCKKISMADGLPTLWAAVQCLSAELKKVKTYISYTENEE